MKLLITPGQSSDKTAAPMLPNALPPATVIADRGYDSRALVNAVRQRGGEAHIPSQSRVRIQRSVSADPYRQRNLAERFFSNLKQFRRIATRFENHAAKYLAAVALASAKLSLGAIESTP